MKKKEDLKAAPYHVFNPDELPRPSYYDLPPETIEVTTLDSSLRRHIYKYPSTASVWSDFNTTLGEKTYEEMKKQYEKEVIDTVNIISEKPFKGEHVVICSDTHDLSTERILKTLSAVKGKLMLDIASIRVRKIECVMTPSVRKNIITASKRLKMYGKKCPIIARFDEYGNRLSDELELSDSYRGISLEIVDPKNHGEFYLKMKAIELPNKSYVDDSYMDNPF
jgi:hypothetical protein